MPSTNKKSIKRNIILITSLELSLCFSIAILLYQTFPLLTNFKFAFIPWLVLGSTNLDILVHSISNLVLFFINEQNYDSDNLQKLYFYVVVSQTAMSLLIQIFMVLSVPIFLGHDLLKGNVSTTLYFNAIFVFSQYNSISSNINFFKNEFFVKKPIDKLSVLTSSQIGNLPDHKQVCGFCWENFDPAGQKKVIATDCGHFFHYHCIRQWTLVRSVCPTCNSTIQ